MIPSVLLGSIVYGLVGLVPNLAEFWKFILILVLFNVAAASVVLFISVAIANTGLANLVGSLVMLYKYVLFPIAPCGRCARFASRGGNTDGRTSDDAFLLVNSACCLAVC